MAHAKAGALPIVLIHGYPLDGSMWQSQAAALTGAGYRVHAPHLPGFGGTAAWGSERCSIANFAEQIHRVIVSDLGGKAVVGGFSMGGYVLMALLREYPESVGAGMFIDTRCEADTGETRSNRLKSIEQVQAAGTSAVAESMTERLLSKRCAPALRQRVRDMILRQTPEGVMGALHAMARRPDSTDLLATITIPMLIVVGDHDVITPPGVAIGMHNHMPHAMLVQIANAGHLAPMEQPEAVNTAVLTFLQTLSWLRARSVLRAAAHNACGGDTPLSA
jgi:pimeloyl-ACP methyl ester carboxylesterase